MSKKKAANKQKYIAKNRRALHNYEVVERFETGIVLNGTEVKSLRAGKMSFADAYASIKDGEVWMHNTHIDEYTHANRFNHNPDRPRKLLLHKKEILRLHQKVKQEGFTLVPLSFYFKESWVKVELGLCKGKKQHDQRQDMAKRDAKRQIERAMKRKY